jgi:hypothetical protein
MTKGLAQRFTELALTNDYNRVILERLPALGGSDCWLVAGCLYQAVWNAQAGQPPATGIKDYDIFYFDDVDLSYEAEDGVIRRAATLFADLDIEVEVRNQARVHLWYGDRFGHTYPPSTSCRHAIGRFLVACTCVGMRLVDGDYEVCAPHGLEDLFAGQLRANPDHGAAELCQAKAESYKARWEWLRIEPWPKGVIGTEPINRR